VDGRIEASTRESLVAEWHHLKGLRQLQADYKVLADFLSTHAKETDLLQGSLTSVLLNAFFLGQKCPPMKRTSPATGKRKTKKQKRLEIVLPLLAKAEAAYPDAGPYSLAKNIKDEVNRQLGEDAVEEDTIPGTSTGFSKREKLFDRIYVRNSW
jgi:hypothetical protein